MTLKELPRLLENGIKNGGTVQVEFTGGITVILEVSSVRVSTVVRHDGDFWSRYELPAWTAAYPKQTAELLMPALLRVLDIRAEKYQRIISSLNSLRDPTE